MASAYLGFEWAVAERFRDGQPADVSGMYNLKTYALVEATYQSAKEKRAVRPDV